MEPVDEIRRKLEFVGMPPETTRIHANRISQCLTRFPLAGFRVLSPAEIVPGIAIVEYEFGDTGYSVNKAKPSDAPDFKPSQHGGSQCDQENLLFLARAFEIAEAAAPDIWAKPDNDLVGKITSPRQHLDTLNEFWWLSRWNSGFTAAPNQNINPSCSKDVDWRLSWSLGLGCDIHINLEVKRRIGDILRSTQDRAVAPEEVFGAGLEDGNGNSKFRPSRPDEVNVLGLTLTGEIDRDVQREAEKWLRSREDIDALLLFTRFSARKSGFDAHIVRKADLLKQFLDSTLHTIDLSLHGRVHTPLPLTIAQLRFLG